MLRTAVSVLLLVACVHIPAQDVDKRPDEFIHVQAVVMPINKEDIGAGCHYELTLPVGVKFVRGVWVIFDRGRDVHDLYSDPEMLDFARRHQMALLLHGHCPGRLASDQGDMNMDPSQGLGPALLRALDRFSVTTGHVELARAKLVLLGFSGAGVLSARLAAAYPQRIIAAVLSAPGHPRPNGIDSVNLDNEAQVVPELILAGGADTVSGTQLPYQYFEHYRRHSAPWTFVLQNGSPHCCTANVKPLMLHWLEAVIQQRVPPREREPLQPVRQRDSWSGSMTFRKSELNDSFGLTTFNAADVNIRLAKRGGIGNGAVSCWLPSYDLAREWLAFVRRERHPVLPIR